MSGDAIGVPDGIHYTIVSTKEVTLPTAACGYNDLGIQNPGVYVVETRAYEEWRDGELKRSWTDDVETFSRCGDV